MAKVEIDSQIVLAFVAPFRSIKTSVPMGYSCKVQNPKIQLVDKRPR